MDYSYFSAPAQSYPTFVGLPPTPAHSYEQADEQNTDPSVRSTIVQSRLLHMRL